VVNNDMSASGACEYRHIAKRFVYGRTGKDIVFWLLEFEPCHIRIMSKIIRQVSMHHHSLRRVCSCFILGFVV
jgi:hypothetical protein